MRFLYHRIIVVIVLLVIGHFTIAQNSFETLRTSYRALYAKGLYEQAIKEAEKASLQAIKEFTKQSWQYNNTAYELASLYKLTGNYPQAIQQFSTQRNYLLSTSGKSSDYGLVTYGLGATYEAMKEYTQAELYLNEALSILTQTKGEFDATVGNTKSMLGLVYLNTYRYSLSETYLTEALELLEVQLGEQDPSVAMNLEFMARLEKQKGNYVKAIELYKKSYNITTAKQGEFHPDVAGIYQKISILYSELGNFREAFSFQEKALSVIKSIYGKEHAQVCVYLSNEASLYQLAGRYEEAEQKFNNCLKLTSLYFGKTSVDYASELNNKAVLYRAIGQYAEAERLLLEASNIQQAQQEKCANEYLNTKSNLASVYISVNKLKEAEKLLIELPTLKKKLLTEGNPEYALSLSNLAMLYLTQQNYEEAIRYSLESTELFVNYNTTTHPYYLICMSNLSSILAGLGKYEEAEKVAKKIYNYRKEIYGVNHPENVLYCSNVATTLLLQKKYSEAEIFFSELTSSIERQLVTLFPSFSEREKEQFITTVSLQSELFFNFISNRYESSSSIARNAYNHQLATKALLFENSSRTNQLVYQRGNALTIAQYEKWIATHKELSFAYTLTQAERSSKRLEIEQMERNLSIIEKSLMRDGVFTSTSSKVATWQEVKSKLKPEEACIEIIRIRKFNSSGFQQDSILYLALILKGNATEPELVVLKNGYEMEHRGLMYYKNCISFSIQDENSYALYWKPFAQKLSGIKRVIVSSDGVYNQLNLATIFNPTTGRYLLNELNLELVDNTKELISYIPSLPSLPLKATLLGFPDYNGEIKETTKNVTAQLSLRSSTPVFNVDSSFRFISGTSVVELPGTKVEVETISQVFKRRNIPHQVFTWSEASEEAIKEVSSPDVLHIATHGFFIANTEKPKQIQHAFYDSEKQASLDKSIFVRSGLLLSGSAHLFNSNKRTLGREDGILTAYEAMMLPLQNTSLVVLSACETGLGEVKNGEGVYGLQRAFKIAGAKSIIYSLWKVNDETTKELMSLFYDYWLNGISKREAFIKAQLRLQLNYPEPKYWGAFIFSGHE